MDKAETVAEIIVETLMRGAKMRYRQMQSGGEYDFDLVYATGMSVPLEVTMSTDQPRGNRGRNHAFTQKRFVRSENPL